MLLILGLIGAYYYSKEDSSNINYSPNCKKEWVDITVYPDVTTQIPQRLTSTEDCVYEKVYFHNNQTRLEWFSLNEEERQMFKVKGKVEEDVLIIHKIYQDNQDKQKTVLLYISSNLINDKGCINTQWESYCFKNKEIAFPEKPMAIRAIVNTEGTILTYTNLEDREDGSH